MTLQRRSRAGTLLTIAGLGLLALWAYYFIPLARPADVWDYSPLIVVLPTILVGVKLAKLHEPILAQLGRSYKRDLAIAFAIGALAELSVWAFLLFWRADLQTADLYYTLENLQLPAEIAMPIYRYAYPVLGNTSARHFTVFCGFAVLIAIWSAGTFVLLLIIRIFRRMRSKVVAATGSLPSV